MFQSLKKHTSILLGICACLLLACSQDGDRIDSLLDVQKPFGFHWADSREMPKYLVEYCQNQVNTIESILTKKEASIVAEGCLSEQSNIVFLEQSEVPDVFQKGSIRIDMLGEHTVRAYSYVYLHELSPTPKTRKMKKDHAAKLKRKIIQLYGNPLSSGFYDQGSRTGFIASEEHPTTCDFWISNNFGILLCSERVVFLDGFEMSLSIIRLDNSEYGRSLKKIVLESLNYPVSFKDTSMNAMAAQSTIASVSHALSVFNGSLGGSSCHSKNLTPLEKAWQLPQSQRDSVEKYLNNYQGEALVNFIFETSGELGDLFPEIGQDKLTLYFLRQAAEQGSAAAMNEIGASLFYCNQGVEKDVVEAKKWFDQAIEGGDIYAVRSKAFIELQNKDDFPYSRERGLNLLAQCSESHPELCEADLEAISTLIKLK